MKYNKFQRRNKYLDSISLGVCAMLSSAHQNLQTTPQIKSVRLSHYPSQLLFVTNSSSRKIEPSTWTQRLPMKKDIVSSCREVWRKRNGGRPCLSFGCAVHHIKEEDSVISCLIQTSPLLLNVEFIIPGFAKQMSQNVPRCTWDASQAVLS